MAKKSRLNARAIIKHITMELVNTLTETQPYLAIIP